MDQLPNNTLEIIRKLSNESGMGLGFCYKALKKLDYDYKRALAYLRSDSFRSSIQRK